MGPGQVPDELLKAVEAQGAEATGEGVVRGRYHPPVHRAEVLEQVGLLLEHGDAEPARERLLTGVHSEVGLQVPRHAELLAAVAAPVLAHRGGLGRVVRGRGWRGPGRGQGPGAPGRLEARGGRRVGAWRPVRSTGRRHRPVLLPETKQTNQNPPVYLCPSLSLPLFACLWEAGYSYSCLGDTYQVGGCGDAEGTGRLQPPRGLESGVERDEGRVLCGRVVEAWPPLPVGRHDVRLRGRDRYLLGLALARLQAQREPGGQLPPPLLRLLQRLPPLQQLFLRPGRGRAAVTSGRGERFRPFLPGHDVVRALAGGRGARVQAQIHGVRAVPPPRRLYAALPVPLGQQRLLHAFHVHLRLLLATLRLYEHRAAVRGVVGLPVEFEFGNIIRLG